MLLDRAIAPTTRAAFRARYSALFSLKEIEQSATLQWLFGAMLLFFFATFNYWINSDVLSKGAVLTGKAFCWPYFKHCTSLYIFGNLPDSYAMTTLYMG